MRGRWKWRTVGLCGKHGNGAFEQSLETLICFSLNNIQWALWSALSRCDVIYRSVPFHFVDYFHLPGNTAQARQTLTNLRLGLGVYFGIGLVIIQYADANFEAVIITSFFVAWCYFWCHRPLARAERRCQGPRGSGPAWLWFLAGIPVDWKSKSQPHGALALQRAMRCALCCPLFAFSTSCSFRIFLI